MRHVGSEAPPELAGLSPFVAAVEAGAGLEERGVGVAAGLDEAGLDVVNGVAGQAGEAGSEGGLVGAGGVVGQGGTVGGEALGAGEGEGAAGEGEDGEEHRAGRVCVSGRPM